MTSLREKLPFRSVETPHGACRCSTRLEPRGCQPQVQGLGASGTPVGVRSARFPAVISSSGNHVCNLIVRFSRKAKKKKPTQSSGQHVQAAHSLSRPRSSPGGLIPPPRALAGIQWVWVTGEQMGGSGAGASPAPTPREVVVAHPETCPPHGRSLGPLCVRGVRIQPAQWRRLWAPWAGNQAGASSRACEPRLLREAQPLLSAPSPSG